jgi:hypothetical protein
MEKIAVACGKLYSTDNLIAADRHQQVCAECKRIKAKELDNMWDSIVRPLSDTAATHE